VANEGAGAARWLPIREAVERTGLSRSTLHRRADAWQAGDRSPYAVRSGRKTDGGERTFDPRDLDRVRRQMIGDVLPSVTAEQWAATSTD
jgi:hypothetical protein